jgi:hypothetical protein
MQGPGCASAWPLHFQGADDPPGAGLTRVKDIAASST